MFIRTLCRTFALYQRQKDVIRYQIGATGKTVLLTFEQWINLDDLVIQDLIASNSGYEINDPFMDLSIKETNIEIQDIQIEDIPDEIKEEIQKDLESN